MASLFMVDCNSLEINGLNQRVLSAVKDSVTRNMMQLCMQPDGALPRLTYNIQYILSVCTCVYFICVRCVCVPCFLLHSVYPLADDREGSTHFWMWPFSTACVSWCGCSETSLYFGWNISMKCLSNRSHANKYEMITLFFCVASTQLDPQTLQGKDWQRTVIPMNGVSGSHLSYLYQSIFVLISFTASNRIKWCTFGNLLLSQNIRCPGALHLVAHSSKGYSIFFPGLV